MHTRALFSLLTVLSLGVLGAACGGDRRDAGEGSRPADATEEALSPASDPPAEGPPTGAPLLRTVYVPAYSHLPQGAEMDRRSLVAILLSVRNVDTSATITVTHVDYFDTSGHRVRRYLDAPRQLRPLETAEFTVATHDDVGGSGANFLVYWQGPSDVHPLLAEAVMFAQLGSGYAAFTSRGIALERRPDPAIFTTEEPPRPAPDAAPTAD